MEPIQEQVKKGFEGIEAKLRAEMEAKMGAELDARITEALKKANPSLDVEALKADVAKVKAALGRQGVGAQVVETKSLGSVVVKAVEEQRDKLKSGLKVEVKCDADMFKKGLETTSSDVVRPKWYRPGDVEILRWTPRLRDYMVIIPVSTGDLRYTRDTALYELYTEVATAASATDTSLVVDSAAGFFVGQSISIRTSTVQVRTVTAVNKTTNTLTIAALAADVAVDVAVTSEVFSFTSEAQVKPQGKFKQEEVSLSLKTIATGISPSKEILDDKPRLESTINARLPAAIARSEEHQILRGDGSTDQITGIFSTSGISTRTQGGSDTKADTIRKAISDVRVNGQLAADLILIRPEDLALIELAKDSTGQYVETLQMMPDGTTMLWRTRVIECDALATNKCLVGAFAEGAELYERGDVAVEVFPQHKDYAERNLIYIRAENRIALAVLRPSAFCAVTFT